VALRRNHPLLQLRQEEEAPEQVRQFPVHAVQLLLLAFRKVDAGQLLTHALLYRMPVWHVTQR
jgi:hypothetical protein